MGYISEPLGNNTGDRQGCWPTRLLFNCIEEIIVQGGWKQTIANNT